MTSLTKKIKETYLQKLKIFVTDGIQRSLLVHTDFLQDASVRLHSQEKHNQLYMLFNLW